MWGAVDQFSGIPPAILVLRVDADDDSSSKVA